MKPFKVRIDFTGDHLLERRGITYEEMREMVEENLTVEKVKIHFILAMMTMIIDQKLSGPFWPEV